MSNISRNTESRVEEKYGKKLDYDPLWKGPREVVRELTDRAWLIIFGVFVLTYAICAIYVFVAGDLRLFTARTDSYGRHCGLDDGVKHKKYMIPINLNQCGIDGCGASVCVAKCPTENFHYDDEEMRHLDLGVLKTKLLCVSNVNVGSIETHDQMDRLIDYGMCSNSYFKSSPHFRICLPDEDDARKDRKMMKLFSVDTFNSSSKALKKLKDTLEDLLNNLKAAIAPSIVTSLICATIAFLCVYTSRWLARYFFFVDVTLAAIFCLIFVVMSYMSLKSLDFQNGDSESNYISSMIAATLVFTFIGFFVAVVLMVYFRKKIFAACELMKESSRAITQLYASLIFPILPAILHFVLIVLFILLCLHVYSMKDPYYQIERVEQGDYDNCKCGNDDRVIGIPYHGGEICSPKEFLDECKSADTGKPCLFLYCALAGKRTSVGNYILYFIFVFGYYWFTCFITGFEHTVFGGAFGTWYWARNKEEVGNEELASSIYRTGRFHLGTISFGSLILTFVQMIRSAIEESRHRNQLRQQEHGYSYAAACTYTLCYVCYDLLERLLIYISHKAYLMCAVHGTNFLESAKMAFNLLKRNFLNIVVITNVVNCLIQFAKLLILFFGLVGLYLYYYALAGGPPVFIELSKDTFFSIKEIFFAVILTLILSAILTSIVFSVQKIATSTIFLCVLEDSERNDGSSGRPYFMSDKLRELLFKK